MRFHCTYICIPSFPPNRRLNNRRPTKSARGGNETNWERERKRERCSRPTEVQWNLKIMKGLRQHALLHYYETICYNEIFLLRLALERHQPSLRYIEIILYFEIRNYEISLYVRWSDDVDDEEVERVAKKDPPLSLSRSFIHSFIHSGGSTLYTFEPSGDNHHDDDDHHAAGWLSVGQPAPAITGSVGLGWARLLRRWSGSLSLSLFLFLSPIIIPSFLPASCHLFSLSLSLSHLLCEWVSEWLK